MNKIVIIVFLSLFFFDLKTFSQGQLKDKHLFDNDSMKFKISWTTPSVESMRKKTKTGAFVELYLTKDIRDSLMRLDSTFWIGHLVNDSSDWATNLILYCLYRKDATQIGFVFTNRQKWLRIKPQEIEFWKKHLSKQH